MAGIPDAVRLLREPGALTALCAEHGVELLVLFGSAVRDAEAARDLDVAARFRDYAPEQVLPLADALAELAGCDVDLMVLNTAGPVAREQALVLGDLLHADTPTVYAEAQIHATMERLDTEPLRHAQLEWLAGRR